MKREGSVRDAEDRRLVQTGVVGHPESDEPVAMPTDAADARQFRVEYGDATFWCGELLGGCGQELRTKIYLDRVCHFAHLASSEGHCGRAHRGQDSADHLYISRALRSLPGGLLTDAKPAFAFDPALVGSACTGLTFTRSGQAGENLIVRFADFENREAWARADEERQRVEPGTQWLFAEGSKAVWWAVAQNGHGFRVKCEQRGGRRTVMIETVLEDCVPRWSDAAECRITEDGLWTPYLEELRRAASDTQRPVSGTSPSSRASAPSAPAPGDPRWRSPGRDFRRLTRPEIDREWIRIRTELLAAREAHDRARVRALLGEGRRLANASAKSPPWLLIELGEYETWLTATTPLRQASPDTRNGGVPLAAPIPMGAIDMVGALARLVAGRHHHQVVALDNRLRELLDRLPEKEAAGIRRVLSRYQDEIRRSHAIVDGIRRRSQRDRTRAQRSREAALDRAASVVRDLLNRVAQDQTTVTWAQLRRRAVELTDLNPADEPEVLRRVDAGLAPGTPRLSSLVVMGEEERRAARRRPKRSS